MMLSDSLPAIFPIRNAPFVIYYSQRNKGGTPMKEIPITNIENIRIGNAQDSEGATGCTVLLCEKGAPAGLDVRGGGPASRESELLKRCV